jgi:hypothetical protein
VRVPSEAGEGKVRLRLSMPAVEGHTIHAREVDMTLRLAPAAVEDPK